MPIQYTGQGGVHTWQLPWAGRTLTIQSGKLAGQADAAVTVRYGDTVLLSTAVISQGTREGIDYFPLLVDFEEKFYAAGKIKGSRFIKREGRPSDEAILSGRLVDRSIRPFFDENLRRDVQVVIQALSWDGENDPDVLAVNAASAVLYVSSIPWQGPVACVSVSYVAGAWVVNPTYAQNQEAQLNLLVTIRGQKVVMIEADGLEASEEIAVAGVELALAEAKQIFELFEAVRSQIGRTKIALEPSPEQAQQREKVTQLTESLVKPGLPQVLSLTDKAATQKAMDELKAKLEEALKDEAIFTKADKAVAMAHYKELLKQATKDICLKQGRRLDGRDIDEVRALSAEVGILPRTHGSGLFARGDTQALTVVTLGPPSSEQILDTMEETDTKKRYMHHYNFPAFSVGEVAPNRGPGRREIGHGALAEKSILPVLPDKETFPYTIRAVTEILSSNGSTSQAAVCGSTLALMDAGVPIKKPVAGIAMGIITDNEQPDEVYKILTDIQGLEDHYGEMDFKVAGTHTGITAIQLDVKNLGLTSRMVAETLGQAKAARERILAVMTATIPAPRPDLSPYAPRIYTLRINPEKIGDVIGPKGKIINKIIDETGVDIDIEDDGLVLVTSTDAAAADKAIEWIKNIVKEVAIGERYEGRVTRLMDFGAFVEILPGQEGMVHISELAPWRVGQVSDVVKLGDHIPVKVIEIDSMGRINLSLKETDYVYPPEVKARAEQGVANGNGQRGEFNGSRRFGGSSSHRQNGRQNGGRRF